MRVAIQGQAGSFHDVAARQFFLDTPTKEVELTCCDTFKGTFKALQAGEADVAVVAVENSLYGSIHEVYDQLVTHHVHMVGEITLAVHQQLVGWPGTELAGITEVYSHPAALDQCRNWLEEHLPHAERIEHHDTAGAVEYVKSHALTHAVAIASKTAAVLHDMPVIAENIEDEKDNFTRFAVLQLRDAEVSADANKASLILTTSHKAGALYEALGVFAQASANLTKLESRPIRGEKFRYQFVVEVEANRAQLDTILAALDDMGCSVRLLGHYETPSQ